MLDLSPGYADVDHLAEQEANKVMTELIDAGPLTESKYEGLQSACSILVQVLLASLSSMHMSPLLLDSYLIIAKTFSRSK